MKLPFITLVIFIFFTLSVNSVDAVYGYNHYVDYTVSNTGGSLSNYLLPIYIDIGQGSTSGNVIYMNYSCNRDFSDIRFTNTNETPYSYQIEDVTNNGQRAILWVKVPTLAQGDNIIRMWYGNTSSTPVSDNSVWGFYSNFTTGTSVWSRYGIVQAPTSGYNVAVESSHLYEGNPQILINENNVFKAWTREYNMTTGATALLYGESLDGITWTTQLTNLIQSNSANALWCPVVFRINSTAYGCYVHNGWKNIDFYTSGNGLTWTRVKANAIQTGSAGQWDYTALGNVYVVVDGANDWKILYDGYNSAIGGGKWCVGYATSSDGGITVTKYGSNPVLTGTGCVGSVYIKKIDSKYYCWYLYSNTTNLPTDFMRAESSNMITWTAKTPTFYRQYDYEGYENNDLSNGGQVADPDLLEVNGVVYMWYAAVVAQNGNQQIALAKYNGNFSSLVATEEDKKTFNHTMWSDNSYSRWLSSQDNAALFYSSSTSSAGVSYSSGSYQAPYTLRTRAQFLGRSSGALTAGAIFGLSNSNNANWNQILYWASAPWDAIRVRKAGSSDVTIQSNPDTNFNTYSIRSNTTASIYTKNGVSMIGSPLNTSIPTAAMPLSLVSQGGANYGVCLKWIEIGNTYENEGTFGAVQTIGLPPTPQNTPSLPHNPNTPGWAPATAAILTTSNTSTNNLTNATQLWDYEYYVSHAGDPFTDLMGKSFYVVLFILPFVLMYMQQRSMTIPTVLALIFGTVLIGLIPEGYKAFIVASIAASFAYNLYIISRGRDY